MKEKGNAKMTKKKVDTPTYNMLQTTAFMFQQAWKIRKSVIFICAILVVASVLQSVLQLYIAPVILSKIEMKVELTELFIVILQFSFALLVVSCVNAYLNVNPIFGRMEVRTAIVIQIHTKMMTTSFPNTDDPEFLRKLEKAMHTTRGNAQATEQIWTTLTELVKNGVGLIIYLLLLFSIDPVLIGIILVTSIAGFVVNRQIHKWGYQHREEEATYIKKLDYINDKSENRALAKDVRIFGMKSWMEDIYNNTLHLYEDFLKHREMRYLIGDIITILLTVLRNGAAYVYLILMTVQNGYEVSWFLLYFSAVGGFADWIIGVLNNLTTLHQESLELSVLMEYLRNPEPFRMEGGREIPEKANGTYNIELKHVTLRYPGATKDTLHDFSLKIPAGEKVAIVGLNGAGKTSLVKLICGFYDPNEGEVLINGVNVKELNRKEYYGLFSAVFQNFSVIATNIFDNVSQNIDHPDAKRVMECIKMAGLEEKVDSLPQKEKTHLLRNIYLDGTELSGGEMQRLMLARALYKNAPILVLDEPTAALDPIAESEVYSKYCEMTEGHTSLFISHRLASTRFCNRIILIKDGRIEEEGTHESLLEANGEYAKLFNVQSKYYESAKSLPDENYGMNSASNQNGEEVANVN